VPLWRNANKSAWLGREKKNERQLRGVKWRARGGESSRVREFESSRESSRVRESSRERGELGELSEDGKERATEKRVAVQS
jgi:hypothetical protein